ncbi:MAG TPA: hypothetical protein VM658_18645 [bacterium]|nr:hypothetical protein [bacterium]
MKIQEGGEEILRNVVDALAPPASDLLGRKVIAINEYPYTVFIELLKTMDKVMGFGDLALCKDIGEFAANRDYRSFFGPDKGKLLPKDLFRDCGVYWKSYYVNSGYMKTIDSSEDNTIVRILDFPTMHPAHCRLMEGWMAQAMINAGAVWHEYYERACTSRGDDYHEYWGRWTQAEEAVAKAMKEKKISRYIMTG